MEKCTRILWPDSNRPRWPTSTRFLAPGRRSRFRVCYRKSPFRPEPITRSRSRPFPSARVSSKSLHEALGARARARTRYSRLSRERTASFSTDFPRNREAIDLRRERERFINELSASSYREFHFCGGEWPAGEWCWSVADAFPRSMLAKACVRRGSFIRQDAAARRAFDEIDSSAC